MHSDYQHTLFIKSFFLLLLVTLLACSGNDTRLEEELQSISEISDPAVRLAEADSLWAKLEREGQIPYKRDSIAIFLYKGDARKVAFTGDFNSWGNDKTVNNTATRLEGTDIWYWKTTLPKDARVDYKIIINDEEWILDPVNIHFQWSGFGVNSELRMPEWKAEPLTVRTNFVPKGHLSNVKIMNSSSLGYEIMYRVYTPRNYEELGPLPVIYFTDGNEYFDKRLGAALSVLDNLIHMDKIEPVIAVFVDSRDPYDLGMNRRVEELGINPDYLRFFAEELIPEIEKEYKVRKQPEDRAIVGTSLGGLNATYFGFTRPDLFGKIGIQAPAFGFEESIYDIVMEAEIDEPEIFMSVGTIGDNTEDARRMKEIFDKMELPVNYIEVNEGHSWGAWSAQLDDILIQFFGK